ncbi:MAG: DEAD/DEAH box helicase [Candidatus Buchananbacteria bacterium]
MSTRSFGRSSRFGKSSGRRRRAPGGPSHGSISGRPVSRRSNNRFRDQNINPALFVSKAEPIIKAKPYQPKNAFADFAIDENLKSNIKAKGYVTPTPIQDEAIPAVLEGLDVVGIANTGTGKTAAFLLPLLHKVILNPKENILIIVPTRELAGQINQELIDFRGRLRIFSVCCVGGTAIGRQISDLRRQHNFVIGTPGRLKDLIERRLINPARFATIVLDEADRMLDMGFVNDMRFVMGLMPSSRQTLFFSATVNREVDKLIGEFLTRPVTISVKTGNTSQNVEQDVIRVRHDGEKLPILQEILAKPEFSKVLIFGRTKFGVEKLSIALARSGFKADAIHGNKNQNKRQLALKSFKENKTQILVATDVAARGLDIPNVSHVINFDVPATYDDYVHRIGRTGRADQTGKALTFIN